MIGSQEHPNYRSGTQLTSRSYSATILGLIISVPERPGETRRLWARLLYEEKEPWKEFWLGSGVKEFGGKMWCWLQ